MVIEHPGAVDEFERIVSTWRKEYLGLRASVVASRVEAVQAVVVSGARRSAAYARGTSWPRQFERDLAAGRFD
jgi:hypothetical protein